jgi:hypothetical protein
LPVLPELPALPLPLPFWPAAPVVEGKVTASSLPQARGNKSKIVPSKLRTRIPRGSHAAGDTDQRVEGDTKERVGSSDGAIASLPVVV